MPLIQNMQQTETAKPLLHITLLGGFRLVYGDEPITRINTGRLQALLAYLLLHRQAPQSRQQLAFQFWPDSSEKQAHTNLRKLLFQLRNALPESDRFLTQDHLTVHWRPDAPYTLDVAELQTVLARYITADGKSVAHLRQDELAHAVNLYQGALLPGCFDEWLLPIRQQLHGAVMGALVQLTALLENQRAYRAGIAYARRLLSFDPLDEKSYQRLMQLHALDGDYAAALRVYQECVAILDRELAVPPDAATQAFYERLRHRDASLVADERPKAGTADANPLVGRQHEWQTLQSAWYKAAQGQPHFVCLWGEAGIGKTRLAEELLTWAERQGILTARTRSYEAEGDLAYGPVTEWLRADALRPGLAKLDQIWLYEVARLLPELLSTDATPPPPLTESWQRQRFWDALAKAIMAEKTPLLLLIDDLQWCDQETLAWLRYLLRYDGNARLLIIGTCRSEAVDHQHPVNVLLRDLQNAHQLTAFELPPLTRAETAQLAQSVATTALATPTMQMLYQVTEGYPLFIIEGVRTNTDNHQALPPKVQMVIQARLAQLSALAREVAGLAATVGRHFRFAIIAQAGQLSEDQLVQALDELCQRRIIREQDADRYDFSHDRIREVAYQGLSQVRRRLFHRRVAEALEQIESTEIDKLCGELAAHFEQAHLPAKAIVYYQQAATRAFRLHAAAEVHNFCQHGLRLLKAHPDLPNQVEHEVTLLVMLTAAAASGVQGYGAQDIGGLYERALALSTHVAPDERTISIYYGLWGYYFASAAFAKADGLTEQMPEQARQLNDPYLLELAYHGRGMTMLYRGQPAQAFALYRQSLSFTQSRTRQGETFQQSQTLAIMTYVFGAMALWLQGYPDQAQDAAQAALTLQSEQWTPLNQAIAYTLASHQAMCLGDRATVLAYTKIAVAICDQYELFYWRLFAMIPLLWAESDTAGDLRQRVDLLAQLLEQVINSGTATSLPMHYLLLADLQARCGESTASIATVRLALAWGERTGERWWEAECYRRLGELLLQRQAVQEAQTCLQRALQISRQQGAKALELRTATSLARLWHQQGKSVPAYALLAPIYQWFTEGLDTADLCTAKALLDQLSL